MRRKDREMGDEFAFELIEKSTHGVLSIVDKRGIPYGIPLSIIRKGNSLYFHSAKSGKKVESFENNNTICVTFVGHTIIPELYSDEELRSFLTDESKGVLLTRSVFTTEYESAMVFGKIQLVDNIDESIEALRLICQKYTPSKMDYFDLAIQSSGSAVNIYRIDIEKITGKRKKYNSSGEELKWGRME